MPTYADAPQEVQEHLETVVSEYRPDLAEAGVTITLLVASWWTSTGG